MLKNFLPNEFVKDIFHIKPETLKDNGIKGIITDLDNTLVEWDRPEATPEIIEWLNGMKTAGILVTIVSNNNENRVKAFSDPIGIPFIHDARKPLNKSFVQARKLMGIQERGNGRYWRSATYRYSGRQSERPSYDSCRACCDFRCIFYEV